MSGIGLTPAVTGGRPDPGAAGPTLVVGLRLEADRPVHALFLRARVVIDARRRRYEPGEQAPLAELFGPPAEWRTGLRSLLWAEVPATVPSFQGSTTLGLRVPCTYDMDVASSRYLEGTDGTEVPVVVQLSGTAFVPGAAGFSVEHLPHDCEASWSMPAGTWRAVMDGHFPGHRWVRLGPDAFAALAAYRRRRVLPTWDAAVDELVVTADAGDGRCSPAGAGRGDLTWCQETGG